MAGSRTVGDLIKKLQEYDQNMLVASKDTNHGLSLDPLVYTDTINEFSAVVLEINVGTEVVVVN